MKANHIKKVKNLFFSLFFLSSTSLNAYELEEYYNEYISGKNTVEESLEILENNIWKISSKFDHAIFQVEQEAIFKVASDKKIILLSAFRNTRAFGGFRKERQAFEINYEQNTIFYEYNKEKGSILFDCKNFIDCSFFDNLTLQIQSKLNINKENLPSDFVFNYLDKGQIKYKKFKLEGLIDPSLKNEVIKIKFSEVRDDDKGFEMWFDPNRNFLTYKIFQDFGSQDLTWNLKSKLSEE